MIGKHFRAVFLADGHLFAVGPRLCSARTTFFSPTAIYRWKMTSNYLKHKFFWYRQIKWRTSRNLIVRNMASPLHSCLKGEWMDIVLKRRTVSTGIPGRKIYPLIRCNIFLAIIKCGNICRQTYIHMSFNN